MTYPLRLALPLLICLAAPLPAGAAVMAPLDLDALVARADVIALVRVERTASRWTDGGRHIVTDAEVRVLRAIAGARPGARLVVRRLGGSVGGIGMRVSGAAVLRAGDEALLFTEPRGGARFVVGMAQGAFFVTRRGGAATVARRLAAIRTLAPPGAGPVRPAFPARLDALLARVRDAVARRARAPGSRPATPAPAGEVHP